MQIVTYNKEDDCFSAEIDWEKFIRSESIDSCKMFLKEYSRNILLKEITEKIKTTSWPTGDFCFRCCLHS